MQVEIRSNILGDIAKIRKGVVFKEYATVVDELLQNCQRAGAKNVNMVLEGQTMTIEDDGVGCPDPQVIFEKNTTAWGNEDEAFGEGFFSVFLLADKLEVESCDWRLEVDVLKMFETGNLKIDVSKTDEWRQGFRVRVTGAKVEERDYQLRREARMLGEIAPFVLTLDGHEVEKKPMLEIAARFSRRFANDLYEAVLVPARGYAVIQTFYESRPVREHYCGSVGGKLHFRKGAITLKAPDRKEFIWDEKKQEFEKQLRRDVMQMYRELIAQATDEEIDSYADAIGEYLDVDEYLELLIVDESLFDFLRYAQKEEGEPKEADKEQVKKAAEDFRQLFELIEMVQGQTDGDEEKPKRTGPKLTEVVKKDKRLAWVRASEVDELKLDIRSAEYYGFRVIVARNKLFEKAFQHLGVLHVKQLDEDVEKHFGKDRVGPRTKKEERLLALLNRVETHFDLEPGTIDVANLELRMVYTLGGEEVETETKKVHGLCDRKEKKVYLDRKLVDWTEYRAQEPDYPNVTIHDYRVLMQVMQTVAHELAHLLFLTEDNSKEHSDAESQIYKEIVRLF